MRRTALLTVGVCALLGVAGAGVATASSFGTERPRGVQRAVLPAVLPAAPVERPAFVGRLESVADGVLERAAGRRMTLTYPGADYVKVHFSRLQLAPGDRVTVSDPTGQEAHTYTEGELRDAGAWSMSVSGDTAVVSVRPERDDALGLRSRLAGLGLTVDRVARGLTEAERAAAPRQQPAGREESICGRSDEKADAVCYRSSDPVAYANSRPVARLLIDGIELCTAFRVGPNNRMLTNHHCFTSSQEARRTEVWFNYECARCGGFETVRPTKVWGERVLATGGTLDYTLFSVRHFDAVSRFGFLQLETRPPVRGEELYIPQHPRGMPLMISTQDPGERGGNCAVANPAYNGYAADTDVSYYCDTEGGSSGSPVIARSTNKVIGLHHFGGCPNSGVRSDRIHAEIGGLL